MVHNSFILPDFRRKNMNTKESLPHALGRKALDAMIRREYDGWPPKTQWSLYQPHRPEKKPSEPKDQSKNRL
jgi:hypothetical protein